MNRTCRMKACSNSAVPGTFLCSTHLQEHPICEGMVREWSKDGREVLSERRCKRPARPGNSFCGSHGANSPKAQIAAETARQLTVMERFVQPYQGEFNPIGAFEMEWRRTMGRIDWLERQLAQIKEDQLTFGLTKEEHLGATEFAGTNKTFETKVHIYDEMLWKERTHLLKIEALWLKNGIESAKLDLLKHQVDQAYQIVCTALVRLGLDPREERVSQVLFETFMGEGPGGYLAAPAALPAVTVEQIP